MYNGYSYNRAIYITLTQDITTYKEAWLHVLISKYDPRHFVFEILYKAYHIPKFLDITLCTVAQVVCNIKSLISFVEIGRIRALTTRHTFTSTHAKRSFNAVRALVIQHILMSCLSVQSINNITYLRSSQYYIIKLSLLHLYSITDRTGSHHWLYP